jgi:hypothetical protein
METYQKIVSTCAGDFAIYQLLVFSEADRLGLIDHDVYKDTIKNVLDICIQDLRCKYESNNQT